MKACAHITRCSVVLLLALCTVAATSAAEPAADPWQPIRHLIGDWSGTSTGQAGEGSVTRRYSWVLGDRFINEVNTSIYPPQEKNKQGERHEHWSMFSFDKARKTIVLRQFHVEGFVNTYHLVPSTGTAGTLVFESESFENFSNSWRARETYELTSNQELIETFELAAPGEEFVVYSRTKLTRVQQ